MGILTSWQIFLDLISRGSPGNGPMDGILYTGLQNEKKTLEIENNFFYNCDITLTMIPHFECGF